MIRLESGIRSLRFVISITLLITATACTHQTVSKISIQPPQSIEGSYYTVQPGDTLREIAHSFGLNIEEIASANELIEPKHVSADMRLYLPSPKETSKFLWPVKGDFVAVDLYEGLQIKSPGSRSVRASRSGVVAVAAVHLSGWGKTVILDHHDGFTTVYAKLDAITVEPGLSIRQGTVVGLVASEPLYFEIRKDGSVTQTAIILSLLPEAS